MSLIDDARDDANRGGTNCGYQRLAEEDPALYAELMEATVDPSVMAASISRALQRRGVSLRADTIRRHRRKDCTRCH